ncbi:hypothetical protein ACTUVN_002695 [Pseudomonas caspiana]
MSWVKVVDVARQYRGADVLYCLTFTHDLMKVGRTKNMPSRLEGLSAHGVLKPLIEDLVVQPVEKCAHDAERIALKAFSLIAKKSGPEVFSKLHLALVRSVLLAAADEARDRPDAIEQTHESFDLLAASCGMYASMIHIALARAKELGMHSRAEELSKIIRRTAPNDLNEVARRLLGNA